MARDSQWPGQSHAATREWQLQQDMTERGRRLRALAELTAGKALLEIAPGEWRYVTVQDGTAPSTASTH